MPKIKTSELIGPALDWAVAKAYGKPDRAATPAKDSDLEGVTLPATLYEVVTISNEDGMLLEARVAAIRVIRHGVNKEAKATAPSITALDERGYKFLGTVGDYYLTKEEAELECAHIRADCHTGGSPSTDWAQGGPIIDRNDLCVGSKHQPDPAYCPLIDPDTKCWARTTAGGYLSYGPTSLIAAMRCYVASKMGDEVDVPEELV